MEGSTTAAAPASSSRRMLSSDSVNGEEEITRGFFNFKPRYALLRSIISSLPIPGAQLCPPAQVARYAETRSVQALRHGRSTPSTSVPHRPVLPEAASSQRPDDCGQAWCSGLRDSCTVSAGWTVLWSRAGTDSCPLREARGCRSEEHTSELQSRQYLVCRLLLETK